MRALVMVKDPDAGVMLTAELRAVNVWQENEHILVPLNARPLNADPQQMVSLPHDLFRHILNFHDSIYELARAYGLPSADMADAYRIVAPAVQHLVTR